MCIYITNKTPSNTTLISYNIVLRVSVRKNHHHAYLITKMYNDISTLSMLKCRSAWWCLLLTGTYSNWTATTTPQTAGQPPANRRLVTRYTLDKWISDFEFAINKISLSSPRPGLDLGLARPPIQWPQNSYFFGKGGRDMKLSKTLTFYYWSKKYDCTC
jgi:hypothetical protein